jgi:hypothetical protein
LNCKYLSEEDYKKCVELNEEVGKLLSYRYKNTEKFGVSPL